MKRLFLILLIAAMPLQAAQEKWWDAYSRGVKAVNAKNYDVAVAALQKAMAEMPTESNSARTKNEIITYVPHFWLGIAKFNLGDVDGALREWKISEDQGAIAKTDYYPRLRDWVSRAQAEKVRNAQSAAAGAKNAADMELSQALQSQMDALSAGADRSDTYRAAQRKLQEALSQFNSAGTNIGAYEKAGETASRARDLFARAAEDAKKQKASRPLVAAKPTTPVAMPQQKPVAPPPQQVAVVEPPKQEPIVIAAPPPQQQQVEMIAPAPAKPPVTELKTPPADIVPQQAAVIAPPTSPNIALHLPPGGSRDLLQFAYRAYATGDLDLSERTLSSMLSTAPSGEAYLLRGCARYARAILSRNEALLAAAMTDFKAALKLNRALRLDKKTFSPKLVAFFEQVRRSS